MEVSKEILLNSLADSGVPIPEGVSSIHDLTPSTIFSISSHALRLIQGPHHATSFPPSLPDYSMADRVKIFTDLASSFNNIGFSPDLSFHKFLYPAEEDLSELLRFLVGKLSVSSGAPVAAIGDGDNIRCSAMDEPGDEGEPMQNKEVLTGIKDPRLKTQALDSSYMKYQDDLAQPGSVLPNVEISTEESKDTVQDFSSNECNWRDYLSYLSEGAESSRNNSLRDHDDSQNQEDVLKKLVVAKCSEFQHLNEEPGILKAAVQMVSDGQHPVEFYIEQLNDQVEGKRHKLKELESEWNAKEKLLQERKINLEQSLFAYNPEASGKLTKMKENELETEFILAEVKRREEELSMLSSDLEKQTKLAPRRSYIERINEITKNSRKQDNDVQQILKDTRELRLENNTIQERLNRTYALVAETIFREAKKDPVAVQAYKLLTDIHESFEQIAEKILATDRSRRDAADYEAKVAIITARSLSMSKLQADLDIISDENDLLEQRLHKL